MEHDNKTNVFPGWIAVQCITAGLSHVQANIVCQDKTCVRDENGIQAFALADGAGSASLSQHGAETVTEAVCRLLCRKFDEFRKNPDALAVKTQVISFLIGELEKTAVYYGCGLPDLASTLLAVAVSGNQYILLHIGDGVIGYTKHGQIKVASAPRNGEFCNTTFFVTSDNAAEMLKIIKGEDENINGFVLMSDGSEASLYSKRHNQLAPVLNRLIYRLSITSSEFLSPSIQESLDNVISRKTFDDCSLVLAAKVEKTYAELSIEEQNDYFDIDTVSLSKRVAGIRRKRYIEILNALSENKRDDELARIMKLKSTKYFVKKWLAPLLELGYVIQIRPHIYKRTVGSVPIIPEIKLLGTDLLDKEDIQDE